MISRGESVERGATLPPLRIRDRLIKALLRVEAVPETSAGALLVGDGTRPLGMILVEKKRVCWSAMPGLGRRLGDLLRIHAGLREEDAAALEGIYQRCRLDGRPLGEALLEDGLISGSQLRAALKQHTVESLLAIDDAIAPEVGEWPLIWVERTQRGYAPRYTFSAAEVLAAVGARMLDEPAAEIVIDHLEGLAESGCALVAFVHSDGTPRFVGSRTTLWLPIEDLVDLAAWAAAALEASPGFSPILAHATARASVGGAVAWIYERHHYAALCPNGQAFTRLVATLDNRSLAMVLATKLTVLDRVRERTMFATG